MDVSRVGRLDEDKKKKMVISKSKINILNGSLLWCALKRQDAQLDGKKIYILNQYPGSFNM